MKKSKLFRKRHTFRRKKPILKSRYLWIIGLVLIASVSLFYFLTFSETFQIKNIVVTGEEKASKEEIILIVEGKLDKRLLFFKTKSIFFVNSKGIREDILNAFPQIAGVEISRGLPATLNIFVVERMGLLNWCQENNCFLLDNEGIIFEEASREIDLIKIIDKENARSLVLGERVIEKNFLLNILKLKSNLNDDLKLPIVEISIISNERLNIKTFEGWLIYFNPKEDLDWQTQKLNLVLEKQIPLEKREELEYIELRFGNQAFIKYQ